jgi:hypothetical protein
MCCTPSVFLAGLVLVLLGVQLQLRTGLDWTGLYCTVLDWIGLRQSGC